MPLIMKAQFNLGFELSNEIPVIVNGDSLRMAWAGGLNNPQFSTIDLDFDAQSTKDIFAFDRDGSMRKGFVWNTTKEYYEWLPYVERHFPRRYNNFYLLRDYDGDGKEDIFVSNPNLTVAAYRNTSDTSLSFENTYDALSSTNPGHNFIYLYLKPGVSPILEDLDGDGDLDALYPATLPPISCTVFIYFSNQSMELYGTADSLEFIVTERCWGKITPDGFVIGQWRNYSCDTTCANDGQRRDVVMSQAMHDLNGDGKKDLLINFSHYNKLHAHFNVGTNDEGFIDLTQSDYSFPSYDVPVEIQNQASPYFIDVDHDGFTDMLVANNQINAPNSLEVDTSKATMVDQLYRNYGTTTDPEFKLEKKGYISGEMVDVGFYSLPVFADLNGDDLPDLIIGNQGYNVYGGTSPAMLTYYKNVGTLGQPAYELVSYDFAGVSELNLRMAHPAFADLDGDGDLDLLVGDTDGYLQYFKNKGHPTSPDFHFQEANYQGINVTEDAHPQFFDMNLDGLPDLIVGDGFGRIHYFENDGILQGNSNFDSDPTIEKMGNIFLYASAGGKSTPLFSRNIDSTNNLYCFVSTEKGRINVYGPITHIDSNYTLADSISVEATGTAITAANLTGDSRDELILGQRSGGLYFMKRTKDIGIGIAPVRGTSQQLDLYPNPTEGTALLQMRALSGGQAQLRVTDLTGKVIMDVSVSASNGFFRENLDLRDYPSGVYLVSMIYNDSVSWAKLIKE